MFEGSLYGTSMQSLTLAIWGACRTPDGPGFEPLISKASEQVSLEGEKPPKRISRFGSQTARNRQSCARVFRWSCVTWPNSCGAVRARLFRWLPRVDEAAWAAADGWNNATVAPQLLLSARVGDSAVVGPIHQRRQNLPH